jgi:tRNA-dihydrouridine synthase A
MVGITDRHFRYFMRQITRRTLLYTEMLHSNAILLGEGITSMKFSMEEKPIAIQLAGDDPVRLAECARLAEEHGFDEINFNIGCPSRKVQQGHFGACLMAHPADVANCVAAMSDATNLPVTVKHRTGIENMDNYNHL